jgi:hypothetical protein
MPTKGIEKEEKLYNLVQKDQIFAGLCAYILFYPSQFFWKK